MDVNAYISGYVDGEGSFCVSFSPSNRHLIGWEIRPSFSVSQNRDRSEVLHLLARGLSNRDIGRRLFVSETTVKFHVANIMRKLDVSRRAEAVYAASKLGVI